MYLCRIISMSLTYSFIHTFTYSLTHRLTHTLAHSHAHSLIHPLTHLFALSLTHSLTRPLTHSPYHPLTYSPTHSFVRKTLSLKHSRLSLQSGSLPLFLAVEAGSLGVTKELLSLQAEQQLKAHKPVGKAAGTRSLSTRGLRAIGAA